MCHPYVSLIEHWDVGFDILFHDPIQHRARSISCIRDETFRVKAKSVFDAAQHGAH